MFNKSQTMVRVSPLDIALSINIQYLIYILINRRINTLITYSGFLPPTPPRVRRAMCQQGKVLFKCLEFLLLCTIM